MRSWNWPAARIWLAVCLALLLSACSLIRDQLDPTTVSIRGVPPTLEQLNVNATANAQNQFVNDLIQTADLQPPLKPDDWELVMKAGVYDIGRQCDQYLDVLFRFNREQRAGRQDLAAAAAATGAIMGLSGVSVKAIAITAAAFGLASSLFDASVNSVLFTIEPSALRNVALRGRTYYLSKVDVNKIKSRPDMLIALQGYLAQCSPAAIEANINNAAAGSLSVSSLDEGKAGEAAALAAPATVLLQKTGPAVLTPPQPPAASKNVEQQAQEAVVKKITTKPKPLPPEVVAPHLLPGDLASLTRPQIQQFQDALGVKANGDPGQAGSDTRKALQEFQIGMSKRPGTSWPPGEINGSLGPRTVSRLSGMKAMPRYFLSPFERAYLGNLSGDRTNAAFDVPDVDRLRGVSANLLDNLENNPVLKGKVGEPVLADYRQRAANKNSTVDEQLKLMRDMVADIRKQLALDPERRDLDSILYDKVNP
jgi:hypothetical protein